MIKPNKVITISSIEQLGRWWPFLKEGLQYFKDELKWDIHPIDYYKVILNVIAGYEDDGIVMVLVSGTGQPYGYIVAINNSNAYSKRTVNVYAVFTNRKCPSAFAELSAETAQWAKSKNYEEVQACSPRVSGASIRWFKKHGFTNPFLVFTRPL